MAMFDTVRCDLPLPDGYHGNKYQSKDLDRTLSTYRITESGRLVLDKTLVEEMPEPQDQHYHGVLNFYCIEGDTSAGHKGVDWFWHEYKATFTEGSLVSIETVTDRARA